jgi:hypothetical protein
MKKLGSVVYIVVVAVLLAASAYLAFGDEGAKAVEKHRVVALASGGEVIKLRLDDLKDGETRTFTENGKEIVVTRKGDQLEVTLEGKEGKEKQITVTLDDKADSAMTLLSTGDGVVMNKKIIIKDGSGDGKGLVFIGEDDEKAPHEARIMRWDVEEDGKHVFVTGEGGPHAWSCGTSDMQVFRCKDDETIVAVNKDKLKGDALSCPICGKLMDKLDGKGHAVVKVVTVKKGEEDKSK